MEPVIIVRKPGDDESERVNEILLLEMNKRINREDEVKNSLLEIIVCQMNSILSDMLNQCELKIAALRINDSLEGDNPYHWETIFLFAIPKEYDYNKILDLFSEVKLPGIGGWHIPDELNGWSAVIHIYDGWNINISVSSEDKKYEILTEKIKNVFEGSRKIRIS